MLTRILNDPPLAFALLLCAALILAGLVTFVASLLDARGSGETTAAALKRDAYTAERRAQLKLLQRRERREKEIA